MSEATENQQTGHETQEQALDRLRGVVNKASIVIDNLEHNAGWEKVVEDMNEQKKRLDDTWQFISDEKKMQEYRITKIAVMKILNIIDDYRNDKAIASGEIYTIEHPDKVMKKDYQEK